jgi:hypothetical protein
MSEFKAEAKMDRRDASHAALAKTDPAPELTDGELEQVSGGFLGAKVAIIAILIG